MIAPGTDILAGVAPPGNSGKLFDLYSGTSMSSPHVAGLAALFKEMHPDWSPMMIKSALMTTGYDVARPWHFDRPRGFSGKAPGTCVRPRRSIRASSSTRASTTGWHSCAAHAGAAGCGVVQCVGRMGYSTDPSNLNVASIAIGDLAGHADGHAPCHERRLCAGYVHRVGIGPGGHQRDGDAVHVDAESEARRSRSRLGSRTTARRRTHTRAVS